ncbi:lmo0937 family membrane protein [Pedobacter sp. UC225_65]|uniref:lmo0937 family membrane protein n=1 Tax=Pedobacter sp. UC225_65 TaxID=3350173 RepID=UPI00366E5542
MGNLLYVIAVILVIIWAISFLGGYYTGGIIHLLLVIAIVAILLRVDQKRSLILSLVISDKQ